MTTVPEPAAATRDHESVPDALIHATAELLGEVGPSRMSVRDIADRAGVNKGQIHHYFGGKRALVTEAVRKLATEHFVATLAKRDDGELMHMPLDLEFDRPYWRALTQLILDGDLETATLEFREEISVPRELLDRLVTASGRTEPDNEIRASFAAAMAIELGWSAFQPFIVQALGIEGDDGAIAEVQERLAAMVIGDIEA